MEWVEKDFLPNLGLRMKAAVGGEGLLNPAAFLALTLNSYSRPSVKLRTETFAVTIFK